MANTWNESGTTWGQNQWGDQGAVDVSITGQSLTTDSVQLHLSTN